MQKNQIREDQCCWKAYTSVSWSACQPSACEVAGLIRLMHLLIWLTGLFNESVIFSKRSFFNILRQGHPAQTESGYVSISFPSFGAWAEATRTLERGFQENCISCLWKQFTHHQPQSCWNAWENNSLKEFCAPGDKSVPTLLPFSKTSQSLVERGW